MNIVSIIAVIVSAIGAVFGFIFGMRQNDKRKAAEKAMQMQNDIIKTQNRTSTEAVKDVKKKTDEQRKTAEQKKKEIKNTSAPDSVSDRLERLRK